jgi:hypothetical protein
MSAANAWKIVAAGSGRHLQTGFCGTLLNGILMTPRNKNVV